jgi:hypothetical protein
MLVLAVAQTCEDCKQTCIIELNNQLNTSSDVNNDPADFCEDFQAINGLRVYTFPE